MKKKITEVNPKYVAMLNKAYEKYSKIEVINSTFEHLKYSPHNDELMVEVDQSKKISKCGRISKTNGKTKNDNMKKAQKFRNNYGHKRYSEEENKILKKFLENNPDFDLNKSAKITELTQILPGRRFDSIKLQIRAIRLGLVVSRVVRKAYSLTEDKLIIDEAIRNLKLCKSLREVSLKNSIEFFKSFDRSPKTICERWEAFIKCWLLQYYNKNLNQEVRPMLVDLIHRNFDSLSSIDWEFIASHKEFSGYTIIALKRLHQTFIDRGAKFYNKRSYELSMKEIANYADYFLNKKLRTQPTREKRKMDCIAYFEEKISEQNFSFSKT